MIRPSVVKAVTLRGTGRWSNRGMALRALLVAGSLFAAACSSSRATSPSVPVASDASIGTSAKLDSVTAGVQIGTAPTAPAGWAPPAKITPVPDLPGKFQSVGDTPPPGDKVRVFFFGMQF